MIPISLSPRPDRLTTSMSSGAIFGARRIALRDRVGALERRHNAFRTSQAHGCLQGFLIGGRHVLRPAGVMQGRVLRADRRVVQAGGNGVGQGDLAGVILQDIGIGSLQYARAAALETCGVVAQGFAASAGLDADQADVGLFNEVVEGADGIGAAAHAATITAVGNLDSFSSICRFISCPMTRWKSRTMVG